MVTKSTQAPQKNKLRTSANLQNKELTSSSLALPAKVEVALTDADREVAESLGIVLAGSAADCINRSVELANAATRFSLESGYLLLRAKSLAQHGEFETILKKQGIDIYRAAELMRNARFYTSLSPTDRAKVFSLGKSKLLLLADADPEVVEDVLNDPTAGLESLSVRGLRQRIAQLEGEKNDVQAKLNTTESKLKRATDKTYVTGLESRTEDVRQEALALQLGVELNLHGLRKLFDEQNLGDIKTEEGRLRLEQVWIITHAAVAKALDTLAHIVSSVRVDDLPERAMGQHILSPAEAERWIKSARDIENRHEAATFARSMKREDEKPRGRGRPKKQG